MGTGIRAEMASTMQQTYHNVALATAPSQTSLIRMQAAALLEEQSVNHEAQRRKAEPALEEVKRALLALPPREPISAQDIDSSNVNRPPVCTPFPIVRPSVSANHRYGFAPPAQIEVIGSFALETSVHEEPVSSIDLAAVIPEQLLEAKDYLDYRYFHKKAFYLACIADGLRSNLKSKFDMSFEFRDGNELQPCLILEPTSEQSNKKKRRRARIRVLVGPPATLFRPEKLRPWARCLRSPATLGAGPQLGTLSLSPLYNGTIASERLFGSYSALQKHTAIQFPGFRNACKLGRMWLRQRGFSSTLPAGGFGAFEFGVILALFLKRDHNIKGPLPSSESDGYQLFRSFIQVLASRNAITEPVVFGNVSEDVLLSSSLSFPLFYDGEREHNLVFKMSVPSYEMLKAEAKTTLSTLTRPGSQQFYPTFIARLSGDTIRFDHVFDGTLLLKPDTIIQKLNGLHATLKSALRDRALLVDVKLGAEDVPEEWPCSVSPPEQDTRRRVRIGILADSAQIARRVDLGPLAEETEAAAKYRTFWGDIAELRRFASGEIRESVTWPAPRGDVDILNLVTSHVVARHFPKGAATISTSIGDDFASMLHPHVPTSQALTAFSSVEEAFTKLQDSLRSVSGHPLRLRQISASASGLRYASVEPEQLTASKRTASIDVVVQFEGSVRWPEHIVAIQHTKTALLSKMAELLQGEDQILDTIVGLDSAESNFDNRTFLDLKIGEVFFRLRIYHDRETALLGRLIKDASLSSADRAMAATAFSAHNRMFVQGPRHTQAVREYCTRVPLLSMTIRLLKLWVSSHLLLPHFRDELLELIAIHAFDFPFPYAAPGSLRTAFLRILLFLSKWDWRNEPLIVNFTTLPLARSDVDEININFQAWRKIDPGMQRVVLFAASNIDLDGATWSVPCPSIVAVNRLTGLARAACAEAAQRDTELKAPPLFACSLDEFDFVLHLNRARLQHRPLYHSVTSNMKTTMKAGSGGEMDMILYRSFIHELERIFGGYVAFFHNDGFLPVVAGVWAPRESTQGMKLGSSWLTIPTKEKQGIEATITPNKPEILHQIADFGGDLVSKIVIAAET